MQGAEIVVAEADLCVCLSVIEFVLRQAQQTSKVTQQLNNMRHRKK